MNSNPGDELEFRETNSVCDNSDAEWRGRRKYHARRFHQCRGVRFSILTVQPTGNVSLMATLAGGAASGVATFTLNNGSASGSTNQLPGGNSYTVKAHYAGDTNYGASDSSAVTVTVNPESSKTKLEIVTFNISTGNVTNSNATTIPYAAPYVLRADVTNASGATCLNSASLLVTYGCPSGSVSFLDNGSALGTPIKS